MLISWICGQGLGWGSQIGKLQFSEISCNGEMMCFKAVTGGLVLWENDEVSFSSLSIPVRKRAIDVGPCLL